MIQNVVFIPVCNFNAIQDDITAKNVPVLLHHTVYLQSPRNKDHG